MNKHITPLVSIIAGIFPALLNYVVAIYLILTGVLAYSKR